MYRVEVFCREDEFGRLTKALSDAGYSFFSSDATFAEGSRVAHVVLYLPDPAVSEALSLIESSIDLRRRENGIYLVRAEAGRAAHYRSLLRRLRRVSGLRPWEEVMEELRSKAAVDAVRLALAAAASLAALAGMVMGSETVVIGAMLISPILGPLFALGSGIITGSWRVAATALKSLALLIVSGLITSAAAAATLNALGRLSVTDVMLARASVTPIYAVLSLVLGTAVTMGSLARVNEALIGVAVAAALIPPIAAASAFAVLGLWGEALGAVLLMSVNLVGLIAGSAVLFTIIIKIIYI